MPASRREGLKYAIRSTAPEGICQSVSFYPGGDMPLPLGRLYTLGIRFSIGRAHSVALLPEVMPLIEQGRLRPAGCDHPRRRLGGRSAGVPRARDQADHAAGLGCGGVHFPPRPMLRRQRLDIVQAIVVHVAAFWAILDDVGEACVPDDL